MRRPDVLDLAAREHRALHRALADMTHHGAGADDPDLFVQVASRIARHEAIDRLLLYPLFGRDDYGRRSLIERRAEQRSLSDLLSKLIRLVDDRERSAVDQVLHDLRLTFGGHADREEIEDFPHARRMSSAEERMELADVRQKLTPTLAERLPTVVVASPAATPARHVGPVQIAVVTAKEILVGFDERAVTVG